MQFQTRDWGAVVVEQAQYHNGRLALLLTGTGQYACEPIGKLTVNLSDDDPLANGEFFVKTWSENERIAEDALASGLFVDTGRRVPTGRVEAQVWRFAE